MPGWELDWLKIAIYGCVIGAGGLFLWAWRDLDDAFSRAFGDIANVEELTAGREARGWGSGCNAADRPTQTHGSHSHDGRGL